MVGGFLENGSALCGPPSDRRRAGRIRASAPFVSSVDSAGSSPHAVSPRRRRKMQLHPVPAGALARQVPGRPAPPDLRPVGLGALGGSVPFTVSALAISSAGPAVRGWKSDLANTLVRNPA